MEGRGGRGEQKRRAELGHQRGLKNKTFLLSLFQWHHCMVLSENQSFIVSLHFAYGLALLKKGSKEVRQPCGMSSILRLSPGRV